MILEVTAFRTGLQDVGEFGLGVVLEHAVHLVAPEGTDRIAHLGHGCVCAVHKASGDVVAVLEFKNLVVVDGSVDAKVVAKVANGIGPLEGKLDTLVQDLAVVGQKGCHAAAGSNGSVEHHVVRNPAVEVKFTAEAVVH